MQVLTSREDASVNFVFPSGQEARFVRRVDDYIIVYLSSHDGCDRTCRFCHLTQSGQTNFNPSSHADLVAQANTVLAHYRRQVETGLMPPAKRVHFNWMARGEPLLSPVIQQEWALVTESLHNLANQAGLVDIRFNISTILPRDLSGPLQFAGPVQPTLYYSLYSLDSGFRRRWLPKALPAEDGLKLLAEWQSRTGGEVVLHWGVIEGENDQIESVIAISQVVARLGLRARFNLVRYNPYSAHQGSEAPEPVLREYFAVLAPAMKLPGSRIVPRVGFDVQASCGMFAGQEQLSF